MPNSDVSIRKKARRRKHHATNTTQHNTTHTIHMKRVNTQESERTKNSFFHAYFCYKIHHIPFTPFLILFDLISSQERSDPEPNINKMCACCVCVWLSYVVCVACRSCHAAELQKQHSKNGGLQESSQVKIWKISFAVCRVDAKQICPTAVQIVDRVWPDQNVVGASKQNQQKTRREREREIFTNPYGQIRSIQTKHACCCCLTGSDSGDHCGSVLQQNVRTRIAIVDHACIMAYSQMGKNS